MVISIIPELFDEGSGGLFIVCGALNHCVPTPWSKDSLGKQIRVEDLFWREKRVWKANESLAPVDSIHVCGSVLLLEDHAQEKNKLCHAKRLKQIDSREFARNEMI